jgi:hypothetical protein
MRRIISFFCALGETFLRNRLWALDLTVLHQNWTILLQLLNFCGDRHFMRCSFRRLVGYVLSDTVRCKHAYSFVSHVSLSELAWLVSRLHLTLSMFTFFVLDTFCCKVSDCVSHLLHHNEVLLNSADPFLIWLTVAWFVFNFSEIVPIINLRKDCLFL